MEKLHIIKLVKGNIGQYVVTDLLHFLKYVLCTCTLFLHHSAGSRSITQPLEQSRVYEIIIKHLMFYKDKPLVFFLNVWFDNRFLFLWSFVIKTKQNCSFFDITGKPESLG